MTVRAEALTWTQRDRAAGALVALAAGDALGAGYEFNPPMTADQPVGMIGGGLGPFAPGEWTDDTSMAIAIASTGADLLTEEAQDYIVERWARWAQTAKDVGVQTRSVLSAANRRGISARTAREESSTLHQETRRTAGNGSLMRTAPVALAYLPDEEALAEAARSISELTHFDPEAGDACVLWCTAIRHAVLSGKLDVRVGLGYIDASRRDEWLLRFEAAESSQPSTFAAKNGWVVAALQGAWSAITTTPVPADDPAAGVFSVDHLRLALEAAVRGGGDTDTVAAIAGALLGAAYGASAVPSEWRLVLKGWPGLNTRALVQLADKIIRGGTADHVDQTLGYWDERPGTVRHPYDDGLRIGAAGALRELPKDVEAVVSLCRVADGNIPAVPVHLDVRLIDQVGVNDNLDFVLLDTVRAIEDLRAEGRNVFLHCVEAKSRTPTIAALYGARLRDISIDEALADVCTVLRQANPNPDFRAALQRLHPKDVES
mgnify:CR=1 FL=1